MMTATNFNPKYPAPSADVLRKLELSRQEAEQTLIREMKCPICSFPVARIPITQTEIVYVKCHKCKFSGPLSPAFFRRMKRYHEGLSGIQRGRMKR